MQKKHIVRPKHKEIGKRKILLGRNTRKQAKEKYCSAKTHGKGKEELFSQNYKKWVNTPKNALLCQNARTDAKENIFQPKYKEVDKKEIFFRN